MWRFQLLKVWYIITVLRAVKTDPGRHKASRSAAIESVPIWGHYHPWASTNWSVKFFADALISFSKYKMPVWKQQEVFVANCFETKTDSGAWEAHSKKLDTLDNLVLNKMKVEMLSHRKSRDVQNMSILDLGCGEGRFLDWLSSELPGVSLCGVDPVAPTDRESIRVGSAYELDFPAGSFDVVFTCFVLQHVSDLDRVFSEVRRVLKPGGLFIVVDRHRHSARGLLMPWHEIKGRWMYQWDSPFRERWYTPGEWIDVFKQQGFETRGQSTFGSPSDKGLRKLFMTNRFLLVSGCLPESVNH